MKKLSGGMIALIFIVVAALLLGVWAVSSYNGLVGLREEVSGQSANIETQLQRRADLIPNLVSTVKGYAAHETEIMTELAEARSALVGAGNLAERPKRTPPFRARSAACSWWWKTTPT